MSSKILILGATGLLGRHVVKVLKSQNPVLAGRTKPANVKDQEWRTVDLLKRTGFEAALSDIDTVVHLASATQGFDARVDVDGTADLLRVAREKGVKHFLYVSIVGIDRVPIKYYKIKLETEKLIKESGVPFTIFRATQFHEFVDMVLKRALAFPLGFGLRGARVQPVETGAVAREIETLIKRGPQNDTIELGGPQVYSFADLARTWLAAQKRRKFMLPIPEIFFGKAGAPLTAGALTTNRTAPDSIPWEAWLQKTYK
ncbi:MAG: NAD(P)H-binding protein [Leptospirales bacterium]|nr:NAD(P)H-binding protein [Leptospirales bacterium]